MDTKIIKTPSGEYEIELKEYITGREYLKLQNVFLQDIKIGIDKKDLKTDQIEIETLNEKAAVRAIEIIVVSVKSIKENEEKNEEDIVDTIFDRMCVNDYLFVKEEVDKITAGNTEDKKKQ